MMISGLTVTMGDIEGAIWQELYGRRLAWAAINLMHNGVGILRVSTVSSSSLQSHSK